jgi:hypothetical protein
MFFICKTDQSKPVKQEVNGTVILSPLVFPGTVNKDVLKEIDSIEETKGFTILKSVECSAHYDLF